MSLTYNGTIFADVALVSIAGRSGAGFYRISFKCQLQFPAQNSPGARIQEFRCAVLVRSSTNNMESHLGEAFTEFAVVLETKRSAWKSDIFFCLDLSALQIEKIEELRNGGDLNFRLMISAVVHPVAGEALAAHETGLSLEVNQRSWLDALAAAGYGRFLLFEIPFPNSRGDTTRAVKDLEKAKEHYVLGHYDEAVAGCRKAIESLTADLDDESRVRAARDAYFTSRDLREDMSIGDRILFLRETIRHLAHPAAHGGSREHYGRPEASLMLGSTAAVIAHALSRNRTTS